MRKKRHVGMRGGEEPIRPGKDSKNRKRIAFLLASIHSGSSTKVWPEILAESKKHQCTLFVFPGGRLASHDEFEYMRNGIFGLVGAQSFDGAISWASSLSGFASEKQVEDFLLSHIDMPLVTFGLKIRDTPVVNIDTYAGMKQLVFHLAKRHKCERIAYVGGPRAHSSAEDRYRAYRDALGELGLRFDPNLASLDNSWTEGRKAMLDLLDGRKLKPGTDFDALCAASDLLAFEAAELLQERGFRIPADIALGGFNDTDESNLFSPTYTTVRMPFERQAPQAFHMLLDRLDGKNPADKVLKTKLVIRQSCGCLTESVHLAGMTASSRWKGMAADAAAASEAEILHFVASVAGFTPEESSLYLEPIVSSFLACLSGRSRGRFLNTLDTILNGFIFRDGDIETFQDILSALRISCRSRTASPASEAMFETLLSQGRVLVSDAEKRISNYRAWKEKEFDHWLYILNHELLCAKDFEAIVSIAGRCLPKLNIQSGFFVLNGKDPAHRIFAGGFDATGSHDGGAKILEPKANRRLFPSSQILPEDIYPVGKGAYIVLPLYYESTSLGYVILRLEKSDAYIFEELRAMFSSAMRGVLLFEQVNEARKRAEKAEKMKTEFLAGISGELQEPMGFIYGAATRLLADAKPEQREDLEAIASYSARQMELTRHLLDLSLAQVDDLALHSSLFDPRSFMEGFAAASRVQQRRKKWGPVGISPPAGSSPPIGGEPLVSGVPLAWGDVARVAQVLEIFLDCLFRDLGTPSVEIVLGISPSGIGFKIGGGPSGERAARNLDELRSLLEAGPGIASMERMKIELELAKRIAFLHGGSLRCEGDAEAFSLELCLPYPSMEPSAQRDASDRWSAAVAASGTIGVLGGRLPAPLLALFPGWTAKKIGIAEAGGSMVQAEAISLLYIDPTSMQGEEAAAAGLLLDNGAFRRVGCYVPASSFASIPASWETNSAADSPSLGDFLLRFVPAKASNTVLVLGAAERGEDPAGSWAISLAASSAEEAPRLLRCRDPEELELLAEREPPCLLILLGQKSEFIGAIADSPALANIPLLCVAARFDDASFEKLIADRPRTIICNSGDVFRDVIASIAGRLPGGEELLPAPTGAIIMKAIVFLNRYFREQVSRWKLSEYVNASEDYLSRIFHKQMGIPLWEYLNRLRIGYAIELLKSSAESVAEVASRSGFQDQAYFCRVFRRITGATPGAIRKESGSNVRIVQ